MSKTTYMCVLVLVLMHALSVGCALVQRGAAPPQPVYFTAEPSLENQPGSNSILEREMVRQAVLLAARQELSLITRDAVLDEPKPEDVPEVLIETHVAGRTVELRLQGLEPVPGALEGRLPEDVPRAPRFRRLVTAVEAWSRQELPDRLREAGLAGEPMPANGNAALPADIAELVPELNLLAQYELVRRAHAEIRRDGESPALLAALSRGYALLGQLTRPHFNASEQVFYARGLLYAERLVQVHGRTPEHLRQRALARALAGLDWAGVDDIEEAHEHENGAEPASAWAQATEAYLYHDLETLEQLGRPDGEDAALARYLHLLHLERTRIRDVIRPQAHAVLELAPRSLRAVDAMAQLGGVANLHEATVLGPNRLAALVSDALPGIDEAPDRARDLARQAEVRDAAPPAAYRELVSALREGDDLGAEMSWTVLGQLIHEANFLHVYHRALFLRFSLSVPVDGYLHAALPTLGDHRYKPILESLPHYGDADAIAERWRQIEFGDLPIPMAIMFLRPWWFVEPLDNLEGELWDAVIRNRDPHAHDVSYLAATSFRLDDEFRRFVADYLTIVSPHSPVGPAHLVRYDWQGVQERDELEQYRERFSDHPLFVRNLARSLVEHGPIEDAQQVLRKDIDLSNDRWAYERLAETHLEQGDEDAWLRVLDDYLAHGEESALNKPMVARTIAYHFNVQGRFDKAEPYARRAAGSGAAWGMRVLAETYEGMGQYAQAERLLRRMHERYDASRYTWYWFVRRTGHGDADAAAQMARTSHAFRGHRPRHRDDWRRALFLYMEGELDQAVENTRTAYESLPDPSMAIQLVHYAQLLDRPELEQQYLDALLATEPHQRFGVSRHAILPVIRYLEPALRGEAEAKPDPEEIDRLLEDFELDASDVIAVSYLTARLLDFAGHEQLARRYWRRCVAPTLVAELHQTLAHWELRQRGVEPYALLAGEAWPEP